jgi:hypothetical protein
MSTSPTIKIIKEDSVIPIRISAPFYNRIKNLLLNIIATKSKEDLAEAYEQISKKNIKDHWIQDIETLYILCGEFEKQAEELGLMQEITTNEYEELVKKALNQK